MTLSISDRRVADAIVQYILERVRSELGSSAFLDHRFGVVASTSTVGGKNYASVYLGGDTYASPNFRIPLSQTVSVGQAVRVVIDKRGDRYVSDVF